MTTPTADLLTVLDIARDGGSVDRAITRAGKAAIVDAAARDLIEIVHNPLGVVSAHYATEQADYMHQRDRMRLQLTPAGASYLAGA